MGKARSLLKFRSDGSAPKDYGQLVASGMTLPKRLYGLLGVNGKSHGTKPKARKRK